ncbi:MAG: hypothetical protein H6731_01595 [Myxococcales bacterium]|nr:MAG: hypothetical protein H6731_01595 [Myxococcales bacterium]
MLISAKVELKRLSLPKNIPVLANLDFGHTTPIFTIPIGGRAKIEDSEITITQH